MPGKHEEKTFAALLMALIALGVIGLMVLAQWTGGGN